MNKIGSSAITIIISLVLIGLGAYTIYNVFSDKGGNIFVGGILFVVGLVILVFSGKKKY